MPWEQITGKHISIDHGETPQVFRAATESEMRLMLCAPDMLAALKHSHNALLDYVDQLERLGSIMGYGRSTIAACEAAIAKAEGR